MYNIPLKDLEQGVHKYEYLLQDKFFEDIDAPLVKRGEVNVIVTVTRNSHAFEMDFETGELVYLSPKYKFKLNTETGELEAEGRAFSPEDVLLTIVIDWLESIGITLPDDFDSLKKKVDEQGETVEEHTTKLEELADIKGTVLWTKTDEVFASEGRTIELDLTEYKRIKVSISGVLVECDRTTSSEFVYYGSSSVYNMWRRWTITDSGISFTGVNYNGSFSNGHDNSLLPLKIIGYKF